MREEIEKVFLSEIKEKKTHAHNNRSRTGGGGGSSSRKGVRTAYDYMSSKEKKNLNSEVSITNMYETIIPYKEFTLKDIETQKTLLTRWRELYPNKKIIAEMEFPGSPSNFYTLVNNLNVPKKGNYGPKGPKDPDKKTRKAAAKIIETQQQQQPVVEIAETLQPTPGSVTVNGLYLQYNGLYSPEQLEDELTRLQVQITGKNSKYMFTCHLTEIRNNEE